MERRGQSKHVSREYTDSCLEAELTGQTPTSHETCTKGDNESDGIQQLEKSCPVDYNGAKPKTKLRDNQKIFEKGRTDQGLPQLAEEEDDSKTKFCCQRIGTFIEKSVEFCQANVKGTKAEQISEAVFACVQKILHSVAEEDPRFRSSDILRVGSFCEGTKIVEPDEFDFIVVIDELSQSGAIAVVTKDIRPGYVEVLLTDETLKKRWIHTKESGVLHNFQEFERSRSFSSVVLFVLAKMAEEQSLEHELSEFGYLNLKDSPISLPLTNDIRLMLKYAEAWSPNAVLNFQYESMTISVDISPGIRYHKVNECFNPDDCISQKLAEAVLSKGSILLVNQKTWDTSDKDPDHEHVFRITFTETEVQFVKHMHHVHKQIYVFLKYLNEVYKRILKSHKPDYMYDKKLPTYLLKLACLSHDLTCGSPDSVSLIPCLCRLLPLVFSWYLSYQYTSVFNRKLLVCKDSKNVVNDYRKMFDFLVDFCFHTFEVPDFTGIHFNPTPFIESKMREIYASNTISLQNQNVKLVSCLVHFLSSKENPEEFLEEVKSERANSKKCAFPRK